MCSTTKHRGTNGTSRGDMLVAEKDTCNVVLLSHDMSRLVFEATSVPIVRLILLQPLEHVAVRGKHKRQRLAPNPNPTNAGKGRDWAGTRSSLATLHVGPNKEIRGTGIISASAQKGNSRHQICMAHEGSSTYQVCSGPEKSPQTEMATRSSGWAPFVVLACETWMCTSASIHPSSSSESLSRPNAKFIGFYLQNE